MHKYNYHIEKVNTSLKSISTMFCILCFCNSYATTYLVNTKSNLQSKMVAALPGDTIVVANGTYNWGLISFVNTNGSQSLATIVLKAQTFKGVVFNGSTRFEFAINNMLMTGFLFSNGDAGASAVIKMGKSSTQGSNYCRITNIIIDNYNADSSAATGVTAEWIGVYGTHNRVDHCTFINKYYGDPVIAVWFEAKPFPQKSPSTYHRIDSNYFRHIAYQGANGGESIRVGVGASSNSDGYNIVEYNLFEDGVQVDPEIISNKSCYNTYRYNTFKNTAGGITLRRGRYCNAYGNFMIRNSPTSSNKQYGFRIFEKGHKVFNNYIEGVNSNQGTYSTTLCPINIENGESPISDTITTTAQSNHFPADSCIVAFNTIVNAYGGQGIAIGFTAGGSYPYQPTGVVIANNLIKMLQGVAVYNAASNTSLTYFAEGNLYNAPNGLAPTGTIIPISGFTNTTLNFGTRTNGILQPPLLVQDAGINTLNYSSFINGLDAIGKIRSTIYDIGATELNSTGNIVAIPLDSNMVGAGKPEISLPVHLVSFKLSSFDNITNISWDIANEINFKQYELELSVDGQNFKMLTTIAANGFNNANASYSYKHINALQIRNYYRLKMIDKDGSYQYSPVRLINIGKEISINVYPNPTQKKVTIDINGVIKPQTLIILFDTFGKEVKRKYATNSVNFFIEELPTGLYHLQIIEQNKTIFHYPLMIVK